MCAPAIVATPADEHEAELGRLPLGPELVFDLARHGDLCPEDAATRAPRMRMHAGRRACVARGWCWVDGLLGPSSRGRPHRAALRAPGCPFPGRLLGGCACHFDIGQPRTHRLPVAHLHIGRLVLVGRLDVVRTAHSVDRVCGFCCCAGVRALARLALASKSVVGHSGRARRSGTHEYLTFGESTSKESQ